MILKVTDNKIYLMIIHETIYEYSSCKFKKVISFYVIPNLDLFKLITLTIRQVVAGQV